MMNLFGLDRYQVAPNVVVDILQRSIGVYQTDRTRSLRRTVNIFWWLKMLLVWISRAPFSVLRAAGFDAERAEASILGRLVKGLLIVIPAVASLLAIADLLGALDWIKHHLGIDAAFWQVPD